MTRARFKIKKIFLWRKLMLIAMWSNDLDLVNITFALISLLHSVVSLLPTILALLSVSLVLTDIELLILVWMPPLRLLPYLLNEKICALIVVVVDRSRTFQSRQKSIKLSNSFSRSFSLLQISFFSKSLKIVVQHLTPVDLGPPSLLVPLCSPRVQWPSAE